jgi:hypothetical protein
MSKPQTSVAQRRAPIGRRPGADPASAWIHKAEATDAPAKGSIFTARLTIDVTPALRGRIKIAAFQRGVTVADMLRALLDRAFPDDGGAAS